MDTSSILFHSEDTSFALASDTLSREWICESIRLEKKQVGDINVIFCSDSYLLKMNQSYLEHDTFTDVITFNYVEGSLISGDIFISIDRIEENAKSFEVDPHKELHRVIIHGVLHLLGYNDKTPEEAQEIRAKEDFYLTLLAKN